MVSKEEKNEVEAPESHPDPARWWRWVCYQSWFSLLALAIEVFCLIRWGIPEAATAPLFVATAGLAVVASVYSAGSAMVDIVRARVEK